MAVLNEGLQFRLLAGDLKNTGTILESVMRVRQATTRHLFDNLRARGFEGSRIGAGLGKLLRQAGKEGFNLRYLGPNQDALTMELPIGYRMAERQRSHRETSGGTLQSRP